MSKPATSRSDAAIDPDRLLALHGTMVLIRKVEERLSQLFADGEVPGFIHLSIGQEAIAAGVNSGLSDIDTVASTHRGHGHALAKGVPLDRFFAEIMGRDTGLCRGRGGSMHVADTSIGMLGANGIVGAGIPLAMGSALAHQTRKTGGIAVAFFGDGALAEGVLHETLNMASLWSLPLLFVCENNGWSEFSPTDRQFRANIVELASVFGIEGRTVDGDDLVAVTAATQEIVAAIRHGGGPYVLEAKTNRVRGHYEGDAQTYRTDGDRPDAADPIARSRAALLAAGLTEEAVAATESEAVVAVETAVEAARAAPPADVSAARNGVYTDAVRGAA